MCVCVVDGGVDGGVVVSAQIEEVDDGWDVCMLMCVLCVYMNGL